MGFTYMSCMAIYSKYASEMISMKNSIVILIDSNGKTHSKPHSQQAFNLSLLNEPITSEEVDNSLYREKLNRAPVVGAIPAEDCEIRFALIYCIG